MKKTKKKRQEEERFFLIERNFISDTRACTADIYPFADLSLSPVPTRRHLKCSHLYIAQRE